MDNSILNSQPDSNHYGKLLGHFDKWNYFPAYLVWSKISTSQNQFYWWFLTMNEHGIIIKLYMSSKMYCIYKFTMWLNLGPISPTTYPLWFLPSNFTEFCFYFFVTICNEHLANLCAYNSHGSKEYTFLLISTLAS